MSNPFPSVRKETQTLLKKTQLIPISEIHAPDVKWVHLRKFDLSTIKDKFVIADFERKTSMKHINRIMESIMNNEFFDNVAHCIKQNDGKYYVFDGQHRLSALWKCHLIYGLKTYDLVIGIHNEDNNVRIIYEKINQGMKLRLGEILKSIDDGKHHFFNTLRDYCDHYKSTNKISYLDALNCINARKSSEEYVSVHHAVNISNLRDILASVTIKDIAEFTDFMNILYSISKEVYQKPFGSSILRVLYRFCKTNNLNKDETMAVINYIRNNNKIRNEIRRKEVHDELVSLLGKKLKEMH